MQTWTMHHDWQPLAGLPVVHMMMCSSCSMNRQQHQEGSACCWSSTATAMHSAPGAAEWRCKRRQEVSGLPFTITGIQWYC